MNPQQRDAETLSSTHQGNDHRQLYFADNLEDEARSYYSIPNTPVPTCFLPEVALHAQRGWG